MIPAAQYREHLPAEHHHLYDELIGQAAELHRLDYEQSTSEAHMAASLLMLSMIDTLIAVWDGQPARAYGGTADVVGEARAKSISVQVIWPEGVTRD